MSDFVLEPLDKKQKRYSVAFNEFCGTDAGVSAKRLLAQESINCDYQKGVLSAGLGVERYVKNRKNIPSKEKASRFFIVDNSGALDSSPDTTFFCLLEGGELYRYNESTQTYVYQLGASPYSQMVCIADESGKTMALLSSDEEYFVYENGGWRCMDFPGATVAMCACKDRVFLALQNGAIAYSDPTYPAYFVKNAGGGKIQLAYHFGEIVAMVVFENQVYVFHQYGVARMRVTGDVESFDVQPLDYVGGEIYGTSVGVCGNAIFFLAADGVYRFDGSKFSRVENAGIVAPKADANLCRFSVCGDKYILQYVDIDGLSRAVAIAADGKSGYFISEREGLSYSGGVALCQADGYVCILRENAELPTAEQARFVTQRTDFGVSGRKTLRKLRVRGRGLVAMTVTADGSQKEYALSFHQGVASVDTCLLGESFYFSFVLGKNACVQEVAADFSVTKGG